MSGDHRERYRSLVYDSARWDAVTLRAGDIIITTPPKCGTTWTQRIVALLVFGRPDLDRPLSVISPWVDFEGRPLDEVVADLDAQEHRRFIKTHTPLPGLPWRDDVTYLCVARDPRDVALSFDHHMANLDTAAFAEARQKALGPDASPMPATYAPPPADPVERFWRWVEDDRDPTEVGSSLRRTLHHVETFWAERHRPNVVILHYDDLQADLSGSMRRLAEQLDLPVPTAGWAELVDAATFDTMRRDAAVTVPNAGLKQWRDETGFFRRGTSGQWTEVVGAEEMARYFDWVARWASPELAGWIHRSP